jgi:hypothetical protein
MRVGGPRWRESQSGGRLPPIQPASRRRYRIVSRFHGKADSSAELSFSSQTVGSRQLFSSRDFGHRERFWSKAECN